MRIATSVSRRWRPWAIECGWYPRTTTASRASTNRIIDRHEYIAERAVATAHLCSSSWIFLKQNSRSYQRSIFFHWISPPLFSRSCSLGLARFFVVCGWGAQASSSWNKSANLKLARLHALTTTFLSCFQDDGAHSIRGHKLEMRLEKFSFFSRLTFNKLPGSVGALVQGCCPIDLTVFFLPFLRSETYSGDKYESEETIGISVRHCTRD